MKSFAWRGVLAGWALFLLLAGAAYLTPLRQPLLRVAGSDYATVRLLRASGDPAAESRAQALDKLHGRFSAFGFATWAFDLWPWLLGLGVALPVLGGLVGAQRAGGARDMSPASASHGSHFPRSDQPAAGTTGEPPSQASTQSGPPTTWSWNAQAAPRAARPKSPTVESPHGDVGSGEG